MSTSGGSGLRIPTPRVPHGRWQRRGGACSSFTQKSPSMADFCLACAPANTPVLRLKLASCEQLHAKIAIHGRCLRMRATTSRLACAPANTPALRLKLASFERFTQKSPSMAAARACGRHPGLLELRSGNSRSLQGFPRFRLRRLVEFSCGQACHRDSPSARPITERCSNAAARRADKLHRTF
jgi:hypothetical protein